MRDRRFKPALLAPDMADIGVRIGKIRLQRQRLLGTGQCLFPARQGGKNDAEIVMRRRRRGFSAIARRKASAAACKCSQILQGEAEIGMIGSRISVQRDRSPDQRYCRLVLSALIGQHAQHMQRIRLPRIGG